VVSRLLCPTLDNNQRLAGGGGVTIKKREIFQGKFPEIFQFKKRKRKLEFPV